MVLRFPRSARVNTTYSVEVDGQQWAVTQRSSCIVFGLASDKCGIRQTTWTPKQLDSNNSKDLSYKTHTLISVQNWNLSATRDFSMLHMHNRTITLNQYSIIHNTPPPIKGLGLSTKVKESTAISVQRYPRTFWVPMTGWWPVGRIVHGIGSCHQSHCCSWSNRHRVFLRTHFIRYWHTDQFLRQRLMIRWFCWFRTYSKMILMSSYNLHRPVIRGSN